MPLNWEAKPVDFFNLFITPEFREKQMVGMTNMRAAMEGAGSGTNKGKNKYPHFTPFTLEEIDAFIGLFIANGLYPAPRRFSSYLFAI